MLGVVLGAVLEEILGLLSPSDALRVSQVDSAFRDLANPKTVAALAALRPTQGWHLVSYVSYAEPLEADFAYSLLARGSPHDSVGYTEFAGFALAAVLERAGRLQHRPLRHSATIRVARMLLAQGAAATGMYKVGNLGTVRRPLLLIPVSHGDTPVVEMLLHARADAAACDSQGEPALCHALRNVLSAGDGAREIFSLLLRFASATDSASKIPEAVREQARAHLRTSLRYARSRREDAEPPPESFWWASGGRGVQLCQRLFVEVERAAAGLPPRPRQGFAAGHRTGAASWRRQACRGMRPDCQATQPAPDETAGPLDELSDACDTLDK